MSWKALTTSSTVSLLSRYQIQTVQYSLSGLLTYNSDRTSVPIFFLVVHSRIKMNERIISYTIFRGEVKKGSFIVVRTTKMRTPTLQAVVVQIPLFVEENICLKLFRRQISIFCHCDYISFPKIMGSSAYFEVYAVRNVQIWRFSKGFKNLPS